MSKRKNALPQPVTGVASLAPYQQGKSEIAGVKTPLKLSSNESLFGPSPAAIEAYEKLSSRLFEYPNGAQTELRNALAEVHGLDATRIVCGNGSDELICLLIRVLAGPGDDIVISEFSFAMAFLHSQVQGVNVISVAEPAPAYAPDVDALLNAVTENTRMVVIASPNNPMGKYLPAAELARLQAGLPPDVALLVDGAYADYVIEPDFDDGAGLVEAHENVVMTRTLSKLYGLAGLRIGWAYMPHRILDFVQRIRTPFNTNAAALAAAAAAVRDTGHAEKVREINEHELRRLEKALGDIQIDVIPSYSNSYMMSFSGEGKAAGGACDFLEKNGIIPRPVNAGGPDAFLRLTVGRPADNDAVIRVLTDYMKS